MKRSETVSIGEAFRHLLSEEPEMHERLLEMQAIQALPRIFGAMHRYLGTCTIQSGILYMQVHSGAIKQSIMLDKSILVERINQEIGAELLRDIVLR